MAITGSRSRLAVHTPSLTVATTVATALAACAGQVGLAIPAVLNGRPAASSPRCWAAW
jgi:hypothetical protein